MTFEDSYERVKSLPFADGKFENTPKIQQEVVKFNLAKDGRSVTLFITDDPRKLPKNLVKCVENEFNYIVEEGSTYPHEEPKNDEVFESYWFKHYAAILLEGEFESYNELTERSIESWSDLFLGTFYVKPNYIGRCSHVCNAGFIVNNKKRGLGLGKELGAKYLEIAPKLGYVYSVFNLVFETNVASLKIWDSLGFERIGYIKNVAVLKGHKKLIGAYMFGKDLV